MGRVRVVVKLWGGEVGWELMGWVGDGGGGEGAIRQAFS